MDHAKEFHARRRTLLDKMGDDAIAILPANYELFRNGDSHYPFRQNSDFYYLTGFNEPDAVAVFIPKRPQGEFILFNLAPDPKKALWTGPQVGQEGAKKQYGADEAYPFEELDTHMVEWLENRQTIYYAIGRKSDFDSRSIALSLGSMFH